VEQSCCQHNAHTTCTTNKPIWPCQCRFLRSHLHQKLPSHPMSPPRCLGQEIGDASMLWEKKSRLWHQPVEGTARHYNHPRDPPSTSRETFNRALQTLLAGPSWLKNARFLTQSDMLTPPPWLLHPAQQHCRIAGCFVMSSIDAAGASRSGQASQHPSWHQAQTIPPPRGHTHNLRDSSHVQLRQQPPS
jgi:hypothetical protein